VTVRQESLIPAPADDVITIGPTAEMRIVVHGEPQPQGSKTKGRWGNIYDDNDAVLRPWRAVVSSAARDAIELEHGAHPDLPIHPRHTAIAVELTFTYARTGGHFGTGRNAGVLKDTAPRHCVMGRDVDKLARAVLDALTDVGLYKDDKQVVALLARKTYPGGHADALQIPGAVIRVRALP